MKVTKKLLVASGIVLTSIAGVSALSIANAGEGYSHHGSHYGMDGPGKSKGQCARGGYSKSGHMQRGMHLFDKFDTNKDEKVTQDEIDKVRQGQLARYDSNKDGKLSLQEYEALWLEHMRLRMVDRFQALDNDGDAQVTIEEFSNRTSNIVNRFDANDDKVVSRDELRKLHKRGHRRGFGS